MKIYKLLATSYEDLLSSTESIYSALMSSKAVVVPSIDLEPDQHMEIMRLVYSYEPIDPEMVGSINFKAGHFHEGQLKYGPNSTPDELLRYLHSNWHSDENPISDPKISIPTFISMNMKVFTCSSDCGKTIFVDKEKMFEDLPPRLKEILGRYSMVSLSGGPSKDENIRQSSLLNFDTMSPALDHDDVMWHIRNYPALCSHPVTGNVSLNVMSAFSNRLLSSDADLCLEYCSYIEDYLKDSNNWVTWSWSEGDFLLWDNRNVIHSYSGGWVEGERIFNRSDIGESTLYYKSSL